MYKKKQHKKHTKDNLMIEIGRITNQRYATALLIIGSLLVGMAIRKPIEMMYSTSPKSTHSLTSHTHDATQFAATIESLFMHGEEQMKAKKIPDAMNTFKEMLNVHPRIAESIVRLGSAAFQEELYESAAAYFRTALFLDPKSLSTYMRLGLAFHRLKDLKKAENAFRLVIKSAPQYAEAYTQLTRVLMDSDQLDEAVISGKKAVELAPQDIHAHLNLGHVYNKRGETRLAVQQYRQALAIDNDFPNANYNLGYTLRLEGKLKESIPYLEKALRLQPHYPDAHIALAQAYWSLNDFEKAWDHYYHRWHLHGVDPTKLQAPLWDGSDLQGKTILLYAEQGFGDTVQFIRFAKEVKKRGARVICKVQGPLKQLLSDYPYADKVIFKDTIDEPIDYQIALMSVPGVIKMKPETIPADIPYLKADEQLVKTWKERLAADKNFKIGICWKVDPQHEATKSPLSLRSVPLSTFGQLADIPGVSFYSLQKTHETQDFKDNPSSFYVHTFNPNFDEANGRFMDTVAVIQNLDMIISVDTVVIHLAAALGKPTWVILPTSPDCRWYFEGDTTPWYPTMRMFREKHVGDFDGPMQQIKQELAKVVAEKKKVK